MLRSKKLQRFEVLKNWITINGQLFFSRFVIKMKVSSVSLNNRVIVD